MEHCQYAAANGILKLLHLVKEWQYKSFRKHLDFFWD